MTRNRLTGTEESESTGQRFKPVEEVLGRLTFRSIRCSQGAKAAILAKSSTARRAEDYAFLTERRQLTKPQLGTLIAILTDRRSYWTGSPKYRRFPPSPGLIFKIYGGVKSVDVLVDLQNPGWMILCADERHWGFNYAGPRLKILAKELFPEYASPSRNAVWKQGTIEALESLKGASKC